MASEAATIPADPPAPTAGRTLTAASLNHALHDGYTDLIYILLPVWQAEFGLGYAALALLRTLYSGVMALLHIPATRLARRFGARSILIAGTLLSAFGYALAGASGGLLGLCVALAIGGAGSSTQHPLSSAAVSRAYGSAARGPLGTYNFAGDLGKATVPLLVGFLLQVVNWRFALCIVATLGLAVAAALGVLLQRERSAAHADSVASTDKPHASAGTRSGSGGFWLLVAIGTLDNAARPAFLLYLPFLLKAKGAELATVGVALTLVFVGGALGKAAFGWLGARLGVSRTVVLTEIATALGIGSVVLLPLAPSLVVLPVLGAMLNGTSSVLYGTVPELAPDGHVERAFGTFYTCTLGGSALALPLLFGPLGAADARPGPAPGHCGPTLLDAAGADQALQLCIAVVLLAAAIARFGVRREVDDGEFFLPVHVDALTGMPHRQHASVIGEPPAEAIAGHP